MVRIRRSDNPPACKDFTDPVNIVARSLALRLEHAALSKILDGTATSEDIDTLHKTSLEQTAEYAGSTRLDLMALTRLCDALKSARFDNKWKHVDLMSLRSSREFAGV